jgi:ADYC domain
MQKWMLMTVTTLAGCDAVELASVSQAEGSRCPPVGCFNSPEIEHERYGMHELHLRGRPNLRGIAIQSKDDRALIVKGGTVYALQVENGRLFGIDPPRPPLAGPDLVGAEIVLEPANAPPFVIHIDAVRPAQFELGPQDPFEAYKLSWHELGKPADPRQKACVDPNLIAEGETLWYENLGLEPGESVVFEGDRIDGARKSIDGTWQPDWFSIGCAGTALGKLYMLRETTVSSPSPDLARHRATLKMLVADYCGTGVAFTVAGEPLFWRSPPRMDYPGAEAVPAYPYEIEARWTAEGAACLGTPRLAVTEAHHAFGDVAAAIAAECPGLPACANTDAWDFDKAILVTANPPLNPSP